MAGMRSVEEILAGTDKIRKQDELVAESNTGFEQYLPASVKRSIKQAEQAKKRQAYIDAGEDPRISQYYDQQEAVKQDIPGIKQTTAQKQALADAARRNFLKANPDLDPSQTSDVKLTKSDGKKTEESAEEVLRKILQVVTTDTPGKMGGMEQEGAIQAYLKILPQLTPGLRRKYNLDEAEKAGLFNGVESGFKASVGRYYQDLPKPIKQTLSGIATAAAVGGVGIEQAGIGLGKGIAALDGAGGIQSTRDWVSPEQARQAIRSKAGFGDWLHDNLQRQAEASGNGRASILGVHAGALNDEGRFEFSDSKGIDFGHAVAVGGGIGGDLVSDPTSYISMGAGEYGRAGFKALERSEAASLVPLLKKGGWEALDEVQQAAVTDVLHRTVRDGLESGLDDAGGAMTKKTAKAMAEDGGETYVNKKAGQQLSQLEKRGQSGLRVGGRTVLPFRMPGGKLVSTGSSVMDGIRTQRFASELEAGDVLASGNGTIISTHPDKFGLTVEFDRPLTIMRGEAEMTIGPQDLRPGDVVKRGGAKIESIKGNIADVIIDKKAWDTQRDFAVLPKKQVSGIEEIPATLGDVDQGRLFDAGAIDPGKFPDAELPAAPAAPPVTDPVSARAAAKKSATDPLAEAPSIEPITAAEMSGQKTLLEQAAKEGVLEDAGGGVQKFVDQAGQTHYLVEQDGKIQAFLTMASEDGQNVVRSLYKDKASKLKGAASTLYSAADRDGWDIATAGAEGATDAGRKARGRYLASQVAGPEIPKGTAQATNPRALNLDQRTLGVSPRMIAKSTDVKAIVDEAYNIFAGTVDDIFANNAPALKVYNRLVEENGLSKLSTGADPVLRRQELLHKVRLVEVALKQHPTPTSFGDDVAEAVVEAAPAAEKAARPAVEKITKTSKVAPPETYTRAQKKSFREGAAAAKSDVDNNAAQLADARGAAPEWYEGFYAATEAAPAPLEMTPVEKLVGKKPTTTGKPATTGKLQDITPLEGDAAFGGPGSPAQRSRETFLKASQTAEGEGMLFDLGEVMPDQMLVGDTISTIGARITKTADGAGRVTVRFEDDGLRTIVRGDHLEELPLNKLEEGMELAGFNGRIDSINADGTFTMSGLRGGFHVGSITDLGGATLDEASLLARKLPADVAFHPRAAVRKAERISPDRVRPGTSTTLRTEDLRASGALGKSNSEIQTSLRGSGNILKKAYNRTDALTLRSLVLDVGTNHQIEAAAIDAIDAIQPGIAKLVQNADDLTAAVPVEKVIEAFNQVGREKVATALRNMNEVADHINDLGRTVDGTILPGLEKGRAAGLPFITTKTGKKAINGDSVIRRIMAGNREMGSLGDAFDWGSSLRGQRLAFHDDGLVRTLTEGGTKTSKYVEDGLVILDFSGPVRDVNTMINDVLGEHIRRALGMKKGEDVKMFVDSPTTAYFMQGHAAGLRAVEADMITNLSKPMGSGGGSIVEVVPKLGKNATEAQILSHDKIIRRLEDANMQPIPGFSTSAGVPYAQREVADHLSRARKVFHDDEALKSFQRGAEWFSNYLARYQTSVFSKGTSFTFKNGMGNIIANTMAGVTNPVYYKHAQSVMRTQSKINKLIFEGKATTWEDAARLLGKNGKNEAWKINAARAIMEDSVTSSGFFSQRSRTGAAAGALADRADRRTLRKFGDAANPLDQDFFLARGGQTINQAVEDNARIAHYLSKVDQLGDRVAARASVATTLFDYDDLTTFENVVAKRVNRFYTYARKNMGLQAYLLVNRPGAIVQGQRIKDRLIGGGDGTDYLFPGEGSGGDSKVNANKYVNKLFGGGDSQGVIKLDTPFDAAMSAISPVVMAAYSMPGIRDTLPPAERFTAKDIASAILNNNVSGGPAQLVATTFELAAGRDIFRDKDLDAEGTQRKLVDLIFPLYNQLEDRHTDITERRDRASVIKLITSIAYTERNNDKSTNALQWALVGELDETLARLEESGLEVPTITDLRDAGLFGKPEAQPRKIPTTAEEKRDAARLKLGL